MRKWSTLRKITVQQKSTELIQSKLNFMSRRPNDTLWSSLQDALGEVLCTKNEINNIFQALDNARYTLTNSDFMFIDEFLQCTKPMFYYYDITTPTRLALRRKQKNQIQVYFDLAFCTPVAVSILKSTFTPFVKIFQFDDIES